MGVGLASSLQRAAQGDCLSSGQHIPARVHEIQQEEGTLLAHWSPSPGQHHLLPAVSVANLNLCAGTRQNRKRLPFVASFVWVFSLSPSPPARSTLLP